MDRDVVMAILGFCIPGLIIWIWTLWQKVTDQEKGLTKQINDLALRLADGYHNKQELREVIGEQIAPLREDIKQLKDYWLGSRRNGNGQSV